MAVATVPAPALPMGRSAGHDLTTRWIQRFRRGTLAIQLFRAPLHDVVDYCS
jgi:hypothetical protein